MTNPSCLDVKKILITGNKGFVATNLIKELKAFPEIAVHGFDLGENIPKERFDVVVHLAALARTQECTEDPFGASFISNIELTNKILKEVDFKHLIYAGSCACYGSQKLPITEETNYNPPSIYAAQKAYSETLIKHYLGERSTILRLFNTYGPGQRQDGCYPNVIASMIKSIKQKGIIEVTGNGLQTRDFVFIDDVVSAFIKLIEQPIPTTLNICSGKSISILELANLISKKVNKPLDFVKSRGFDILEQVGDNSKSLGILGWGPTVSIFDGIDRVLKAEGLI